MLTSNHKIYAGATVKKNSLKILPFATVQLVKPEEAKGKRSSSAASEVLVTVKKGKNNQYQVLAPSLDLKKETGTIPLYFWVQPVEEEKEATAEQGQIIHGLLAIPCWKPKKQLTAGQQLAFFKPPIAAGSKAKKAKSD